MLNFAERVFTGLLSLSMLLFSSYEGNNTSFSDVLIGHNEESIRIRTRLLNAFDNDFEQIFRSGNPIIIRFSLEVKMNDSVIANKTFINRIVYDPMSRFFEIDAEAANHHSGFVNNINELKRLISEVDIFFDYAGVVGTYHFELTAELEKVYLTSLDREFDLMLLWKLKAPAIKFRYRVGDYES